MDLENELYFNADSFLNENLDPTRREGVEGGATIRLAEDLALELSAAWISATYRGGENEGRGVPLVASQTAAAALRWGFRPGFALTASLAGVSPKWMDNNDSPIIPGYALLDAKVTGRHGPWTVSVSVHNALDAAYFTYAVASTGTPSTYNAYPLAGRTFQVEAARRF